MNKHAYLLLVILLVLLNACNPSSNDNKKPVNTENQKSTNIEEQKKDTFSVLFDMPFRPGSLLSDTFESDGEYPNDIQFYANEIYILSGHERKVITYNLQNKKHSEFSKIDKVIQDKSVDLDPEYIRVLDSFIVVGCDFEFLVFDKHENLLKKVPSHSHYEFFTVEGNKLFVWQRDSVLMISLDNGFKVDIVQPTISSIQYGVHRVACNSSMFTSKEACLIKPLKGNATLSDEVIDEFDFSKYPKIDREAVSLISVTPSYYIWYAWLPGNKLFFVNRRDNSQKVISLPVDLAQECLAEYDDYSAGIRVTSDGDNALYIMIMKKVKDEKGVNEKHLVVYRLNLNR